jgi:hypothetical protein
MPIWGTTLLHIDDLPFDPIKDFSNVITEFRKKTKTVKVRTVLSEPTMNSLPPIKELSGIEKYAGEFIPDL